MICIYVRLYKGMRAGRNRVFFSVSVPGAEHHGKSSSLSLPAAETAAEENNAEAVFPFPFLLEDLVKRIKMESGPAGLATNSGITERAELTPQGHR